MADGFFNFIVASDTVPLRCPSISMSELGHRCFSSSLGIITK